MVKMKHTKKMVLGATLGIILGGLYLHNSHNPSYYKLIDTNQFRIDSSSVQCDTSEKTIDKLLLEPEVFGEKKYKVNVAPSTKSEMIDMFSKRYRAFKGDNPESNKVSEEEILDFSVDYVINKLSFRKSVQFPNVVVDVVRKLPGGKGFFPHKKNEYFHKLTKVDIKGIDERLTDCWDYAELFKQTFNTLSKEYAVGSTAYRVIGDTYFLGMKFGDHDFNLIVDKNGNKKYIDSNGQDTWTITNPIDITNKVKVPYENK
jgi:hypothetical protein